MAMVATRSWLYDIGNGLRHSISSETKKKNNRHKTQEEEVPPILGILSFKTAQTMARLLSLYKSLSDGGLNKLHNETMKSKGVSYLNSKDETFLLNLSCAERIEDLDCCAVAVTRLGKKCADPALCNFKDIHYDLKFVMISMSKLGFMLKEVDKNINKMKHLISATSNLYMEYHSLSELEVGERKLQNWEGFNQQIASQRKLVEHYKEISLWTKPSIRWWVSWPEPFVSSAPESAFGPYISVLPQVSSMDAGTRSHSRPLQSHSLHAF